ncbi:hypothetical protein D3C85_1443550 [compost metagenome]
MGSNDKMVVTRHESALLIFTHWSASPHRVEAEIRHIADAPFGKGPSLTKPSCEWNERMSAKSGCLKRMRYICMAKANGSNAIVSRYKVSGAARPSSLIFLMSGKHANAKKWAWCASDSRSSARMK